MNKFHYTSYNQEVIFGAGSLVRLSEVVDRFQWGRLMLLTSGSARRNGWVAQLEAALGSRLVAVYESVKPHVPDFQVAEAAALAVKNDIDGLISMGGGSPIGMAKAVSSALEEKHLGGQSHAASPRGSPLVPILAIPTTYAGSEMTPVYGVTHHDGRAARKITATDARVTPRSVLYDPLLTLDLPPEMTATTGINALAHCIEALYSITRNPLSTAAALSGVRHIANSLTRCYAAGDDLQARTEMMTGAYLAGTALAHVAMGLHHGLCHVLGGSAGVPHGIANSIVLPHAMRYNLDATAPELARAAEAMGIALDSRSPDSAAQAAVQRVSELIRQMHLPMRLRDAGVNEADLPLLAQLAVGSRAVQSNPKPISDAAQMEAILRAAW